jgi:Flp pilus assembly secretin CpaC
MNSLERVQMLVEQALQELSSEAEYRDGTDRVCIPYEVYGRARTNLREALEVDEPPPGAEVTV